MKNIFVWSALFIIVVGIIVPHFAFARDLFYIWDGTTCATSGSGPDSPCGLCDALVVGRNIIEDMFKVALVLAVIFIAYGGFVVMTAGGNEKNLSSGKGVITSAFVGLLIALAAWLIINTIFNSLIAGHVSTPWNSLDCTTVVPSTTGSGNTGVGTTTGGGGIGGGNGETGTSTEALEYENGTFTGGGGKFGGGGASDGLTGNGATQSEISKVLVSSCASQADICAKGGETGSNEGTGISVDTQAAYTISCKKVGTGYDAKFEFKCLSAIFPPWIKCSDGLPDLSKVCK